MEGKGRIGAIGNDGEEGKGGREGGAAQPYRFSKVGAYAGHTYRPTQVA